MVSFFTFLFANQCSVNAQSYIFEQIKVLCNALFKNIVCVAKYYLVSFGVSHSVIQCHLKLSLYFKTHHTSVGLSVFQSIDCQGKKGVDDPLIYSIWLVESKNRTYRLIGV